MIWHIFRKDVKLLWPLVLLVTVVQVMNTWLSLFEAQTGASGGGYFSSTPSFTLQLITLGCIALLIGRAVHLDATQDYRQDWHTRPINRARVLLAKFLFLVTLVQLPMLISDLAFALASGFSLRDSLAATGIRNLQLMACCGLPAMALAALTRNTIQQALLGVPLLIGSLLLLMTTSQSRYSASPTAGTAVDWLQVEFKLALLAAGAAAVLCACYLSHRRIVIWGSFAAVCRGPDPVRDTGRCQRQAH